MFFSLHVNIFFKGGPIEKMTSYSKLSTSSREGSNLKQPIIGIPQIVDDNIVDQLDNQMHRNDQLADLMSRAPSKSPFFPLKKLYEMNWSCFQ